MNGGVSGVIAAFFVLPKVPFALRAVFPFLFLTIVIFSSYKKVPRCLVSILTSL
jgi:uncharacterized BrkB/YihY/UPF0761 family membrane protein